MKKKNIYSVFLFILFFNHSFSQNLVPNPSFEDYSQCPTAFDQINRAVGWSSYKYSPDYFNTCAAIPVSVPNNGRGQQIPLIGDAYAGIGTYDAQGSSIREFIGIQLTETLIPGNKYFVSAYVSRSNSFVTNGASNKFGFRFSTIPYDVFNPVPVDNFSHIHSDSLITDSINWTKIGGSFIADSLYRFLIIGNFYDDANTDTLETNGFGAFYYIDAVCVSSDSLYDLNWTSIETPLLYSKEIVAYPNPVIDVLYLSNITKTVSYLIFDSVGQQVAQGIIEGDGPNIHLSSISNGIYLLVIENKYLYKIIIDQ
jgi:hypothetical protein